MTTYFLEITLCSSLSSSGGEGRAGQVDREAVWDRLGLPILPGRRLKGLWRDAYRDVAEAWAQCGMQTPSPEALFGRRGRAPGRGGALVQIDNARLWDAEMWTPWVCHLMDQGRINRDDLIRFYAGVRAQTSDDRKSGAPKENTLRFTRVLHPGHVFRAPVRFVGTPTPDLLRGLALGAAALQRMGSSRTRALGEVKCRLIQVERNADDVKKPSDLTQLALEGDVADLAVQGETHASWSAAPTSTDLEVGTGKDGAAPTHFERYRLILLAPAVVPDLEGDPNKLTTRNYIPGSNLWGAVAWAYLSGHTSTDPAFQRAFRSGGLRFLPAFPESADEDQRRLIPIPHSIREKKDGGTLIDYLEDPEDHEAVRRMKGFAAITPGHMKTQSVETRLAYHHERAQDRRKGRALGSEVLRGGTLFVYESIQPGQVFQGVVLGDEEGLNWLRRWLPEGQTMQVGRSRSAEYGGQARLEWIDSGPVEMSATRCEWQGFREDEALEDGEGTGWDKIGSRLIITTLSSLLTVNERGHPAATFPEEELREVLGVEKLTLLRSYTRTELVGGYDAHLNLPRQQWPAVTAGSVFEFGFEGAVTPDRLFLLERDGLGLRREAGFGRVAVNRHGALGLRGEKAKEIASDVPSPMPDGEIPEALMDFLNGIVRLRCQDGLREFAREIAEGVPLKQLPTGALLSRVDLILSQNDFARASEIFASLRKPAREKLGACPIEFPAVRFSIRRPNRLMDFLTETVQDPSLLVKPLAGIELNRLLPPHPRFRGLQQALQAALVEDAEALVRGFWQDLLAALGRRRRHQAAHQTKGARDVHSS